jgi:ribosomal protein S4E
MREEAREDAPALRHSDEFVNRFEPCRSTTILLIVKTNTTGQLKDGARCKVIGGTHAGKTGTVHDIKTGKTGHVSITVKQPNGVRLKTLAKNVVILTGSA